MLESRNYLLILLGIMLGFTQVVSQEIDIAFNPMITESANAWNVQVTAEDQILISGDFQFQNSRRSRSFCRLYPDGQLDPSFSYTSEIENIPGVFKPQHDGKVLIGGSFFDDHGNYIASLLRLNRDGSIDQEYTPITNKEFAITDLVILKDKKVFLSYIRCDTSLETNCGVHGLLLLESDGTINQQFSSKELRNLPGMGNAAPRLAALDSNDLFVAGIDLVFGERVQDVYRLNYLGEIDTVFNPMVSTNASDRLDDIAILQNGVMGILTSPSVRIPSESNISIFRSSDDSVITHTLNVAQASLSAVNIDSTFIVAGNKVISMETDGSSSVLFEKGFNGKVYRLATCSGGGQIVAGSFQNFNNTLTTGLRKLVKGVSTYHDDPSFKASIYRVGEIRDVLRQKSGKLIVGGDFDYVNGQLVQNLVRLNSDGEIDSSFNTNHVGVNTPVFNIREKSDESILLSSRTSLSNPIQPFNGLINLDKDGNLIGEIILRFEGSRAVSYLDVDGDDNIYVGLGGAVATNGVGSQELIKIELTPDYERVTDLNQRYIDDLERYNGFFVQDNDRLVIYGHKIQYDGSIASPIVRTMPDGERDTTFQLSLSDDFMVRSSISLDSGKILLVGNTFDNELNKLVAKLAIIKSNGAKELSFFPSFTSSDRFGSYLGFTALLPNGHIIVSGVFNDYDHHRIDNGVALIDQEGNFISPFLSDFEDIEIEAIAIIDDESYYIAGDLISPSGAAGLVRVLNHTTKTTSTESFTNQSVQLFPNPVGRDFLTIKHSTQNYGKEAWYTVYDASSGKAISSGKVIFDQGAAALNLYNIEPGALIINIWNADFNYAAPIVKM